MIPLPHSGGNVGERTADAGQGCLRQGPAFEVWQTMMPCDQAPAVRGTVSVKHHSTAHHKEQFRTAQRSTACICTAYANGDTVITRADETVLLQLSRPEQAHLFLLFSPASEVTEIKEQSWAHVTRSHPHDSRWNLLQKLMALASGHCCLGWAPECPFLFLAGWQTPLELEGSPGGHW